MPASPNEMRPILRTVRAFVQDELLPLESDFLHRPFTDMLPVLEEKRQRVKSVGFFAPHIPREWGGMGLRLSEFALLSEELGRTPLGHYVFNCQAPDVGNMEILIEHGTPDQQERYLRPLIAGEIRSCYSMTEPGFPGSNPVWMGTTAEKDGGEYLINGQKWFTTAAEGAAFAIVMAISTPEAEPHRRATQIIVPTDTPGFRIVRNIQVMGEQGSDYATHAEIVYDRVRVPLSNRLGPEGEGFSIAQDRLGPGRIHHCMRWIGICERAFDIMCQHAAGRMLKPGEPLAHSPIVQTWVAESRAEINAARLMVLDAARQIETKGSHAARESISLIKFYVAGVLQRVLDRAIQTLGAMGLTDDTPLAYWYRHERAARIYDGPDEVHKISVARRILKDYGA